MADNNGKIYIIVTDKIPGGETPTPEGVKNPAKDKDENDLFGHWAKNQMLGLIKQVATQQVEYTINNIGNFTGDYERQTQISNTKATINKLVGFGQSIIAGAKVGGVYGALIAAAVHATSSFISDLNQLNSIEVAIKKQNYQTSILRQHTGLDVYTDGSRGTLY